MEGANPPQGPQLPIQLPSSTLSQSQRIQDNSLSLRRQSLSAEQPAGSLNLYAPRRKAHQPALTAVASKTTFNSDPPPAATPAASAALLGHSAARRETSEITKGARLPPNTKATASQKSTSSRISAPSEPVQPNAPSHSGSLRGRRGGRDLWSATCRQHRPIAHEGQNGMGRRTSESAGLRRAGDREGCRDREYQDGGGG